MDWSLDEAHEAVADLAARILADARPPVDGWMDRDAWRALADAGLVGIALPPAVGGGLGFLAVHLVLEAVGRTAAAVPYWETVVLGALPLARSGGHGDLLRRVVAGDALLTGALGDDGVVATPDGDGWRLRGTASLVPLAPLADAVVVAARTDDGRSGLFLTRDGTVTPQRVTSDVPHGRLELDGARADAVGPVDAAGTSSTWSTQRAAAGVASLQAGLCDAALRLAATYTSRREQFGRPIATFQAVGHRVADAYIDTRAARLTALQAAWQLDADLPARDAVATAKFWAAEAGHRVLHAAHHVHGGVGVDRDYPLHRYFLRTKQLELTLGTATDHLRALGAALAAEPA